MRQIIAIQGVLKKQTAQGKKYTVTLALLDDGTEASGYGGDYKIGDKVKVFFDEKYNLIKMDK